MLTRYWFEFEKSKDALSYGLQFGCGVTAFDYQDALALLSDKFFKNKDLPAIYSCVDNIDIRTLDQGHIIPNLWLPCNRGIWFPIGYQDYF